MQILPKIRTKFGENIGVELYVSPPTLGENKQTFLSTDTNAGVSAFSVDNGLMFGVNEYLLVGFFGGVKSEIVKVHGSTTPTGTTVTLTSVDTFPHNRGEKLTFLPYNQLTIQRSTDGGSTYSDLITLDIRADSSETAYQDTTGLSTYYYRVKFLNSTSSLASELSDAIIATGFVDNSVGLIIRETLISSGEKIDDTITKEFLYTALNEGRDELDNHPEINRWSFRTAFDYDLGDAIPGQYKLSLPTNIRDSDSYESILKVKVGKGSGPLTKADRIAFNNWYDGIAHTTLASPITNASISLVLTSTGDFNDSGSVDIAASSISETIDAVAYTTNTESTRTLGGVTGVVDNKPAGVDVWQGASFGTPTEFFIDNGYIVFSQPFSDDIAGENIWLDYYKKLTTINSDGDLLDEPYSRIYIPYLRYRIKKRRNPSLSPDTDDDYLSWVKKRDAVAQKEFLGQDLRIEIDVPC
jgi:hypothetical protein